MRSRITNPSESYTKDFRICYEVEGAGTNCTPWASQGGPGPVVNSNGGFTNFHGWVETQALQTGKILQNVQVGSQLFYGNEGGGCEGSSGVAWSYGSGGASESNWAFGANQDNDPGCVQIWISGSVVNAPAAAITIDGSMTNGTVNRPFTQVLNLSNDAVTPCTWTLVSIDPEISGAKIEAIDAGASASFTATPSVAGTYRVTVKADCQNGQTVTRVFDWVVENPPVSAEISISGTMPNGATSEAYTYTYSASGNTSALTWSLESISPSLNGATVNSSTGQFSAIPLVATTYTVVVKASQADGATATKSFTWVVDATIENPPLPPAASNVISTGRGSPTYPKRIIKIIIGYP
jgi:hypothetical protein